MSWQLSQCRIGSRGNAPTSGASAGSRPRRRRCRWRRGAGPCARTPGTPAARSRRCRRTRAACRRSPSPSSAGSSVSPGRRMNSSVRASWSFTACSAATARASRCRGGGGGSRSTPVPPRRRAWPRRGGAVGPGRRGPPRPRGGRGRRGGRPRCGTAAATIACMRARAASVRPSSASASATSRWSDGPSAPPLHAARTSDERLDHARRPAQRTAGEVVLRLGARQPFRVVAVGHRATPRRPPTLRPRLPSAKQNRE